MSGDLGSAYTDRMPEKRQRVVYFYGGPASGIYVPLTTPDVMIAEIDGITYMQSSAPAVFTPSGLTAGEIEAREAKARGRL